MTGADGLPPHLAPWAAQLTALDPRCASAVGPFVRGLDALMGGEARSARRQGEFDGYDGLSRVGTPERLLMSEWLLAEEAPEEFLRRAAQRELLHLAPARRAPDRHGRVAVLADTGPSQLGAARLVQLAALMVAHRRAAARGTGLLLGLLGGKPGEWHEGDLPELLRTWLAGRTAVEPAPVDVDAWTESLDAADEAWVLAGEPLAARVGARHKVLVTRESGWSDAGAAEVTAVVGGRTVRLALPDPEAAVRILRGEGWRRGGPAAPLAVGSSGLRQVAFAGNGRRLLARSDRADELITVHVPQTAHLQEQSLPRRHRFPWPVLAAGYFGRRLVVLGLARDTLRLQVVGKPWKVAEGYAVPAHHLGITAGDAHKWAEGSLAPLVVTDPGMMCRWAGDWYRMPWDGMPRLAPDLVSALPPGTGTGPARVVLRDGGGLRLPHLPEGEQVLKEAHAVLGPGIAHARSLAGHVWRFAGPDGLHPGTRRTEEGEEPLGVVLVEGGQAHLVTRSASGLLLRLRGPVADTVLTKWSGSPHPPALHPSLPLLAVQRQNGTIDVADLATGNRLLTLRSDA